MKLLWLGDLAASGFGTVTSDTGRELVKLGVDVRFLSQNEFGNLDEPFLSRTLDLTTLTLDEQGGVTGFRDFLPSLLTGTSEGMKLANGESWGDWKPDACILLGDFYGMRLMVSPYLDAFRSLPTFHYVPIEGIGLPPLWNDIWSIVKPIAMTDFGADQIAKVTGQMPPMVYHGVDTDAFHPASVSNPVIIEMGELTRRTLTSRDQCKAFFGLNPAVTVVLRTDRHMPRKGYSSLLRAMSPVLRDRTTTALVLHCRSMDQGGFLWDDISKLPPDVQRRVLVPDMGPVPRNVLVAMYNAADLYVSNSAEGFGLTIAEALACGVPAVGVDYSAVPEVIGPAGVCVPVGKLYDNEYAHHWALPEEDKFGAAVAWLLDHPSRRRELGRQGPKHVSANFRWDDAARAFASICEDALRPSVALSEPRSAVVTAERVTVAA